MTKEELYSKAEVDAEMDRQTRFRNELAALISHKKAHELRIETLLERFEKGESV